MRAKEFVINIPLTININGDGEVSVGDEKEQEQPENTDDKVMVPPLQQDLEIKKANAGKESEVIQDLLQNENN